MRACVCATCVRVRRGGEVGWYVPGIGRSSLLPCLLRHWMLNDGFRPDGRQRNKRSGVGDDVTAQVGLIQIIVLWRDEVMNETKDEITLTEL